MRVASIVHRLCLVFTILGLFAVSSACKKKKDKPAASNIEVDNLADLNLSGRMQTQLPDGITAQGNSLYLNAAKFAAGKSQAMANEMSYEACSIRQMVSGLFSRYHSFGAFMCHFEEESGEIEFGKKYDIEIGTTMLQLYVDNSVSDQLIVNVCVDEILTYKMVLDGASIDGLKGTSTMHVEASTILGNETIAFSVGDELIFDIGKTTTGRSIFSNRSHVTLSGYEYNQFMATDLVEGGVSKVYLARLGEFSTASYQDKGAAFYNDDFGQTLFYSDFNAGSIAHRASFDGAGYIVDNDADASLEEGGDLYVNSSDMPAFLSSDFAVEDFSSSDWDCADTEETITVDNTSSAHVACDADFEQISEESCTNDSYAEGEEAADFDEGDEKDADELDSELFEE